MRVETTTRNIYTWDELNEKQQEKAIEKLWDLNVDYDWWDGVYEDASSVGLTISGFYHSHAMKCDVELDWSGCTWPTRFWNFTGQTVTPISLLRST